MRIATLVPAYKPQYLGDLLSSLRSQTHPTQLVIFSDDSPEGTYRQALEADIYRPLLEGLNVEVHDGPRRGGYANMMHLVELWSGRSEFVHLLLDDDVCYPGFYERHLTAHASARLSCSISRRWTADDVGRPVSGQPVPAVVNAEAHRIVSLDASLVFATTAIDRRNWFGEFSNAVFARETVPVLLKPYFGSVPYAGLWDLGAFMAASLQAPVGYIQDHLGYFRTSAQGNSSRFFGPYMKAAHLGYIALIMGGVEIGRYTPQQACDAYGHLAVAMQQRYGSQDDMRPFIDLLPGMAAASEADTARFLESWVAYLRHHDFL